MAVSKGISVHSGPFGAYGGGATLPEALRIGYILFCQETLFIGDCN